MRGTEQVRTFVQRPIPGLAIGSFLALIVAASAVGQAADIKGPGLGDPGKLVSLKIEQPHKLVIRGRDARQQLIVTGHYTSGQLRDLTAQATYSVAPSGVVRVDSSGFVMPQGNGTATVTATIQGIKATTQVEVTQIDEQIPINFPNQITPIFSKLGCNSGGCHGKSSGQNGFKLSLLGFYPEEDYEYLVKEARGRRLFPAAPESSLLLLKATNMLAHGGGQRLDMASYEYSLLRSWIAQGMPYGNDDDPTVVRIQVHPPQRTLDRGSQQQLAVYAHFSDGSVQDVTRVAQYESNDTEMAETSSTGLVRTLDGTGEVAVMVRFQGHVDVFRASLPLGVDVTSFPPERNDIDKLVFAKLKRLGIPPSPPANDAMFVRRLYLDLTGRLPSAEQAKRFVEDRSPNKRDRLIDQLLDSGEYADYFANKWNAILRNQRTNANYTRGTFAFHEWIRDSFRRNKPYDQFVREIVAASGDITRNPPVVWYRSVSNQLLQLEDTAQLFLGLRIQCARCHHHPFEQWSERDYYSFAAFFSRVERKNGDAGNDEPRIFHNRGVASAVNPRTNERLAPAGLGGDPIELEPDDDPRHALVDWMTDPQNPFFAQTFVNRQWKHFFGRGIVDPEDDMRVTNPPTNPELLEALSQQFIASGFDIKALTREICRSSTYQLSSEPNEFNAADKQNFSRYYPKRLHAEVLYDALNQVTGVYTRFNGLPEGIRAVQLPDATINNYFLTVFGKPLGNSPCECERSAEANLAQTLHLLNSAEVQGKLTSGSGRAAQLAADNERSHEERVRELYYWAFAREPDEKELSLTLSHIERKQDNVKEAYEDILWALINAKEFSFVR